MKKFQDYVFKKEGAKTQVIAEEAPTPETPNVAPSDGRPSLSQSGLNRDDVTGTMMNLRRLLGRKLAGDKDMAPEDIRSRDQARRKMFNILRIAVKRLMTQLGASPDDVIDAVRTLVTIFSTGGGSSFVSFQPGRMHRALRKDISAHSGDDM